jgi:excisionase family DNA binding protein
VKRTSTFLPLEGGSNGASHQTVTVPPLVGEDADTMGTIKPAGAGNHPPQRASALTARLRDARLRTSEVRDSSIPSVSVESTIAGQTPIAVTVKQAARLLGTNDKQIRRGIHARELPVVRFGNSYSIGVDDLRVWFDRKKATL